MSKKNKKNKNQNNAIEIVEKNDDIIVTSEEPIVLENKYLNTLNAEYNNLSRNINEKNNDIQLLQTDLECDHEIYKNIKQNAINIQKQICNYPLYKIAVGSEKSERIFFDFENNIFYDKKQEHMQSCYLNANNNITLCSDNAIYVGKKIYASSAIFLNNKSMLDHDLNYISSFDKIIEKTINNIVNDNNKFKLFCMLPESVDAFNTRIRKRLISSKGKIISIPKSIAIIYTFLDELHIGDRFCVIDLDGLKPISTQLSIGKDKKGNAVILREGFIKNNNIKFNYIDFCNSYLEYFESKYSIEFSTDEKNDMIMNKSFDQLFTSKVPISIFKNTGKIDIIFDIDLFNRCIKQFSTLNYDVPNCGKVFVTSTIPGLVTGNTIINIDASASFDGLEKIRNKLMKDEKAIIWKERLPKVSLEVIDDKSGFFKIVNLIDENNDGQEICLSVDEDIELPFKGTITLQKGKKEYYLPLQREIFSEDINSEKEAYFSDKSFPLTQDLLVELSVTYNYMSESPIKVIAKPKSKNAPFELLGNTWVDPHEIDSYHGPKFERQPPNIMGLRFGNEFEVATKGMLRFIKDELIFDEYFCEKDPTGHSYHKSFKSISVNYRQIRALFDSENIKSLAFKKLYEQYNVETFFKAFCKIIINIKKFDYTPKEKKFYLNETAYYFISDFIVACNYYQKDNKYISFVYEAISNMAKKEHNINILAKLSRCIKRLKDDTYKIFDSLSTLIYSEIVSAINEGSGFSTKHLPLTEYVRSLSANCWFNEDWIFMFYHSKKGKECIREIIKLTHKFVTGEDYGKLKKFRDILEFLVCISRLQEEDPSILNPNDKMTKEILYALKHKYIKIKNSLGEENLVSRLESNLDQGSLHGYPNYFYMLIMTLSGEGQVNLVGYHDD